MSITLRAAGTYVEGTANLAPTISGSAVDGDMLLLLYGTKPFGDSPTISAGWNLIGSATNGSTAGGIDSGSMQVRAWWRVFVAGDAAPTVTNTTNSVSAAVIQVFQRSAGTGWQTPVGSGGGDTSSGTGFSATAASNPGITAGDLLVGFAALPTDAATQSSISLSATSATIGAATESPATDLATASGQDMAMSACYASCTAGTASAAPVYASTLASASTGTAFIIRLRESSSLTVSVALETADWAPLAATVRLNKTVAGAAPDTADWAPLAATIRLHRTVTGNSVETAAWAPRAATVTFGRSITTNAPDTADFAPLAATIRLHKSVACSLENAQAAALPAAVVFGLFVQASAPDSADFATQPATVRLSKAVALGIESAAFLPLAASVVKVKNVQGTTPSVRAQGLRAEVQGPVNEGSGGGLLNRAFWWLFKG